MATGAIGGVPTTTKRTFNWSGALTNFVFYTCPANTISYVNLSIVTAIGPGAFNNITLGVSVPGTYGTVYFPCGGNAAAGGSYGIAMGVSISANPNLYGRLDNPVWNGSSAYGQLILYPNDSLFVTATILFGGPSAALTYDTLEVTSG